MNNQDQVCCPEFKTEKWDNKTFSWKGKHFLKESIPAFFHIPYTPMINKKMKKIFDQAEKAQANIPELNDALVLFHDPSPFKSEIFLSVTKEVEGANNVSLSGEFVSGVYDGPYNSVPKHLKDMEMRLANANKKAKDYYVHYAYCPSCAKKFGHNYMVLFAEV